MLWGCVYPPPHQRGGSASAELPPLPEASAALEAAPPLARVALQQPENPEGASTMGYRESRVTERPDGTVERWEREAGTDLGGSQDLAEMIEAVMAADLFRALLLAVALGISALVAVSRGWPMLGAVLGMGAVISLMIVWWAGLIAAGAGVLLVLAYRTALANAVPTLDPQP